MYKMWATTVDYDTSPKHEGVCVGVRGDNSSLSVLEKSWKMILKNRGKCHFRSFSSRCCCIGGRDDVWKRWISARYTVIDCVVYKPRFPRSQAFVSTQLPAPWPATVLLSSWKAASTAAAELTAADSDFCSEWKLFLFFFLDTHSCYLFNRQTDTSGHFFFTCPSIWRFAINTADSALNLLTFLFFLFFRRGGSYGCGLHS